MCIQELIVDELSRDIETKTGKLDTTLSFKCQYGCSIFGNLQSV